MKEHRESNVSTSTPLPSPPPPLPSPPPPPPRNEVVAAEIAQEVMLYMFKRAKQDSEYMNSAYKQLFVTASLARFELIMKYVWQSFCAYIFMQVTRHKFQVQTWMYWILMKHLQSIFHIHYSEWKDRGGRFQMQRRVFNWNRTRLLLRDSFRVSCIRFFCELFLYKNVRYLRPNCCSRILISVPRLFFSCWNIDAIKHVKCVLIAFSPVLYSLKPLSLFLFR